MFLLHFWCVHLIVCPFSYCSSHFFNLNFNQKLNIEIISLILFLSCFWVESVESILFRLMKKDNILSKQVVLILLMVLLRISYFVHIKLINIYIYFFSYRKFQLFREMDFMTQMSMDKVGPHRINLMCHAAMDKVVKVVVDTCLPRQLPVITAALPSLSDKVCL